VERLLGKLIAMMENEWICVKTQIHS
jgi:hypothetical protein